jgi:hypothetical protein
MNTRSAPCLLARFVGLLAVATVACPRPAPVYASWRLADMRRAPLQCLVSAGGSDVLVYVSSSPPDLASRTWRTVLGGFDYRIGLYNSTDLARHDEVYVSIQIQRILRRASDEIHRDSATLAPIERFIQCAQPRDVSVHSCFSSPVDGRDVCSGLARLSFSRRIDDASAPSALTHIGAEN